MLHNRHIMSYEREHNEITQCFISLFFNLVIKKIPSISSFNVVLIGIWG